MATITPTPTGVTSPDNWALTAGASKAAAVAAPDDDDTSYLSSGATTNTIQTFTFSPGLFTGDTVTQFAITVRTNRSSNNVNFVVGYSFDKDGGGTQSGESGTLVAVAGWNNDTYTHSGLSAVWGSNLTVYIKNTQNRDMKLTTLTVTITYTPGGGGSTQPVRTMHQFRLRGGI